jgi:DNA polymerase-3 subunit gamma/tau
MGFEMTLLRMLAFRPVADAGVAPSRPVRAVTAAAAEGPRAAQTSAATRQQTSSAADRSAETSARTNGVAAPAADWATIVQSLDLRGPTRQLADNCDLKSNAGGVWQLVLPADKEHLNTQQLRTRLEAALREQYGRDSKLAIVVGQPLRPTPADKRRANESTRMREAREAIENDPNVKAIQAAFDATLEADSIRSSK